MGLLKRRTGSYEDRLSEAAESIRLAGLALEQIAEERRLVAAREAAGELDQAAAENLLGELEKRARRQELLREHRRSVIAAIEDARERAAEQERREQHKELVDRVVAATAKHEAAAAAFARSVSAAAKAADVLKAERAAVRVANQAEHEARPADTEGAPARTDERSFGDVSTLIAVLQAGAERPAEHAAKWQEQHRREREQAQQHRRAETLLRDLLLEPDAGARKRLVRAAALPAGKEQVTVEKAERELERRAEREARRIERGEGAFVRLRG